MATWTHVDISIPGLSYLTLYLPAQTRQDRYFVPVMLMATFPPLQKDDGWWECLTMMVKPGQVIRYIHRQVPSSSSYVLLILFKYAVLYKFSNKDGLRLHAANMLLAPMVALNDSHTWGPIFIQMLLFF